MKVKTDFIHCIFSHKRGQISSIFYCKYIEISSDVW